MKPLKMHLYDEMRDAPVCGIDRRYADTTHSPERVTCTRCLAYMEAAEKIYRIGRRVLEARR